MPNEVSIATLPLDLTSDDAVEAAYRDDLDEIQRKLSQGISVLIECDKQLTVHLFRALRTRFKAGAGSPGGARRSGRRLC